MNEKSTSPEPADFIEKPELTASQKLSAASRERQREIDDFVNQIELFAASCQDLNQIRAVLRNLSRVSLPPNVAASIYGTPQEGPVKNLIEGRMETGAVVCDILLKKAFSLANSLDDVNKILVCHFRVAELTTEENEMPNGSLLYGVEKHLMETLSNNQNIRSEIIQARNPKEARSRAFIDFLFFTKTLDVFKDISAVLLELQTEGFGGDVKEVVNRYN